MRVHVGLRQTPDNTGGARPTATLLACPPGIRPYGPPRMLAKRIVPLIVAVALFMENMDSTVIATSLPAIAADIGTSPLTLKLAVTAYLLSLAVFIPVSGWTADRFGARTVFRSAIAVFMLGSIGCALSNSLAEFVAARIFEGMGGAMMTPVARLILVATLAAGTPLVYAAIGELVVEKSGVLNLGVEGMMLS